MEPLEIRRVRVIRRPIKPRYSLTGLTGTLYFRALATKPIHSGGGAVRRGVRPDVVRPISERLDEISVEEAISKIQEIADELSRGPSFVENFSLAGRAAISGASLK
ncbi:MAG TPA: hypothetical protein ENF83_00505, partial [Candidatus Korarchaeota archaeon]|nr:hypothetical protein [Candidatus Korarchaeota archaeon]